MQRILCAIDQSEQSLRTAKLALQFAVECNADLILVTVVQLPDSRSQRQISDYLRHEHDLNPPGVTVIEAAQDELALLSDRLASEAHIPITCSVRTGEAASEIVAATKDHTADLLVVGHRSHNRIAQVLLGSVAKRVIETAPCPVLIAR